jgi:hypothetical protein
MMRMTLLAATLAALGAATSHARADAPSACFEIVPAQPGAQPAILIDKCSGRTWQLAHGRHGTFRWIALPGHENEPVAAVPATATGKCFAFDGRKFCE